MFEGSLWFLCTSCRPRKLTQAPRFLEDCGFPWGPTEHRQCSAELLFRSLPHAALTFQAYARPLLSSEATNRIRGLLLFSEIMQSGGLEMLDSMK